MPFKLTIMNHTLPPRDPNDVEDEDENEDEGEDEDQQDDPAVIREPDE